MRRVPPALACGELGEGCGMVLQRSVPRMQLVRPPGAPREGNTTVNLLGGQLGSIVLCQLLVATADAAAAFGSGLTTAVPYDNAGLGCPVPALDTRHAKYGVPVQHAADANRSAAEVEAEMQVRARAEAEERGWALGWYPPEVTRLRVSEDGQHFSDVGLPFVYFSPPTVSDIVPVRGPTNGSTVSVHGLELNALLADASAARCNLKPVETAPTLGNSSAPRPFLPA